MRLSEKYFEKDFSNVDYKNAYLDACKWVAKNVMKEVETSEETYWKVVKLNDVSSPTVKLELHVVLDEKTHRQRTCEKCKEFHSLFYINTECDCNNCKMTAYYKNLEHSLEVRKKYRRTRLKAE